MLVLLLLTLLTSQIFKTCLQVGVGVWHAARCYGCRGRGLLRSPRRYRVLSGRWQICKTQT